MGGSPPGLSGGRQFRQTVCLTAGLLLTAPDPSVALNPARAFSQYRHATYRAEDGLPHDVITDIVQDRDGYLWIATLGGLARFDGQRFVVFDSTKTGEIKSDAFRDLEPASGGGLWCATEGGLLHCSAGAFRAYTTQNSELPSDLVQALCTDEKGGLWVGTDRGLCLLSEESQRVYTTRDGLPSDDVLAISRSRTGGVWVACGERGLCRMRDGRITPAMDDASALPAGILCVHESGSGSVWLGSSQGLARLDDGAVELYTTAHGLSHNLVASFLEDGDGSRWVGTHRGLCRMSGDRAAAWGEPAGPISGMVTAMCEDDEGNVWVGTSSGVLHRLSDGVAATFGRAEGLPDNMVMPICSDRAGRVWIGTANGLSRIENGSVEAVKLDHRLPTEFVLALFEDRWGNMWVGTKGGGLCRIADRRVWIYTSRDGLPGTDVFALCEDTAGTLWVGSRSGLYRYDGRRFSPEPVPTQKAIAALHYQRSAGTLWIGTSGDGLIWRGERGSGRIGTAEGLASGIICSITESAAGDLWVGTEMGLALVRGRKAISLRGEQYGFYGDEIFQVLDDRRGNLWMGTREGIMRAAVENLLNTVDGASSAVGWVRYGREDGMRVAECNGMFQPAGCLDGSGRVWFPTPEGAVMIDPPRDRDRARPPPIHIERFVVDGEDVRTAGPIALPAGKKSFGFRYTAPTFSAPARVRFRHRLDGIDADWVDTGSGREVVYANLPAGSYRFLVTASAGGAWNPAAAALEFKVGRHFYHAPWFYALCTLGALASLRWLYRVRTDRLRGLIAVSEERLRISRELHDNVTQDLTGIVMHLQAAESLPDGALSRIRQSISAALASATQSVDEIRRVVWELREPSPERVDIVVCLRQMLSRMPPPGAGVSVDVAAPAAPILIPGPLRHDLTSIVREAVHNAARHSDARRIQVHVSGGRLGVRIEIRDDGKGFEPGTESTPEGRRVGLTSMRERARRTGGDLSIVSRAGEGTVVSIEVPLTQTGDWPHKGVRA